MEDVAELSLNSRLRDMGQELFEPPSVAGWGQGTKWLSSAGAWSRGDFLESMRYKSLVSDALPDIDSEDDPLWVVDQLTNFLGLEDVSDNTATALREWFQDTAYNASWHIDRNRGVIAAMAPEFQVY